MDQSDVSFESQEDKDFIFQNYLQNADLYFQSQDIDNALRLYFEALKLMKALIY